MSELPAGTVTFLFTDIESPPGSSRSTSATPPAMLGVLGGTADAEIYAVAVSPDVRAFE